MSYVRVYMIKVANSAILKVLNELLELDNGIWIFSHEKLDLKI